MNEEDEKAGGEASPPSPLLANQHLWATAVTVASLNEPRGSDFCGTRDLSKRERKIPGFETQRRLRFHLKSPRGISRLSFLCGAGDRSEEPLGATSSIPPCHPPPTFCLSLIKGSSPTYGSSGLQLRQCAACRAQRSPHRVRPPGRPCPGPSSVPPGQVLTRRRADDPGPLRDRPPLALSCRTPTRHGPIQRLAEFKFAHFRLRPGRHGCSAPPRRRGNGEEEGLRLRRGFWGELTRGVSWDGCRRVCPGDLPRAPGTPNRLGLKISIPHANEWMLMLAALSCQGFFYITVPYCPGRILAWPWGVGSLLREPGWFSFFFFLVPNVWSFWRKYYLRGLRNFHGDFGPLGRGKTLDLGSIVNS